MPIRILSKNNYPGKMLKLIFALLIMLVVAGCKADQETLRTDTLANGTEESLSQQQKTNDDKLDMENSQDNLMTDIVETSPPLEPNGALYDTQDAKASGDKISTVIEEDKTQEQNSSLQGILDDADASDSNISIAPEEDKTQEQNSSLQGILDDADASDSNISIAPEEDKTQEQNSSLNDKRNDEETSDSNISIEIKEINPALEPYYHQQWYLEENKTFYDHHAIDANASIHSGEVLKHYSGKDVRIAIIDDGLDVTHEELNNSVMQTYDITTGGTNVSHNSSYGYHGTAVTGIIASNANAKGIIGIAHNAKIIFLKYREGMSDSETIELFQKAEAFGADIINCSWGTYDVSQSVKETIQYLANHGRDGRGTLIVFAVGNDAQEMRNDESAIPEVVAVGATDKDNLRAWYSNFGENLDVMAPGGYELGITTLDDMGDNGISSEDENYLLYGDDNSFIGTSASAPIVTGAIALLLEANPDLTRLEVMNSLKESSDKIGNIEYELGHNIYYGYGKINVSRLLQK